MELARSPSHSSRWKSPNSPRQSGWLQSTLGAELDEKIKTMLQLVEEDADSFAKRAEMYYTKRPELVRLIEEFSQAYQSLAERYDHLKEETGQKITKAVPVQHGLSCESPRGSPLGKHNPSLHKKEIQGFEKLLTRLGSCNSDDLTSETSEVEDPELGHLPEGDRKENDQSFDQDSDDQSTLTSDSEGESPSQGIETLHIELNKLRAEKRRLAYRCKFVLAENKDVCSRIRQIQVTVDKLQEGKTKLFEQLQGKSFQLKHLEDGVVKLKKEIDCLKEENLTFALQKSQMQGQLDTSEAEHMKLREENANFAEQASAATEQNKFLTAAVGFLTGQIASLIEINTKLRNENSEGNQQMESYCRVLQSKETEISTLQDENRSLKIGLESQHAAEGQRVSQLNLKIEQLHNEISCLGEQNRQQHIALLDLSEKKREAIRQLCFAIDTFRDKNHRLEEALRYFRGRHNGLCHGSSKAYYSIL